MEFHKCLDKCSYTCILPLRYVRQPECVCKTILNMHAQGTIIMYNSDFLYIGYQSQFDKKNLNMYEYAKTERMGYLVIYDKFISSWSLSDKIRGKGKHSNWCISWLKIFSLKRNGLQTGPTSSCFFVSSTMEPWSAFSLSFSSCRSKAVFLAMARSSFRRVLVVWTLSNFCCRFVTVALRLKKRYVSFKLQQL